MRTQSVIDQEARTNISESAELLVSVLGNDVNTILICRRAITLMEHERLRRKPQSGPRELSPAERRA